MILEAVTSFRPLGYSAFGLSALYKYKSQCFKIIILGFVFMKMRGNVSVNMCKFGNIHPQD